MIHNREAYARAAWDWDICLKGCFGAGSPSDLDGVYERKGRILILEAKGPGKPLPEGQRILFEVFASKPDIDVVVLRGPKNDPREWGHFLSNGWAGWSPTTIEEVRQFCWEWYQQANRGMAGVGNR